MTELNEEEADQVRIRCLSELSGEALYNIRNLAPKQILSSISTTISRLLIDNNFKMSKLTKNKIFKNAILVIAVYNFLNSIDISFKEGDIDL